MITKETLDRLEAELVQATADLTPAEIRTALGRQIYALVDACTLYREVHDIEAFALSASEYGRMLRRREARQVALREVAS